VPRSGDVTAAAPALHDDGSHDRLTTLALTRHERSEWSGGAPS
jgi:hypothetical protein